MTDQPVESHPLVDAVVPGSGGSRWRRRFAAADNFIRDHVIGGQYILPGVAYLEMARAAALLSGRAVAGIQDWVWARPLVVNSGPADVEVVLSAARGESVCEVMCLGDSEPLLLARGRLSEETAEPHSALDLRAIMARCPLERPKARIYEDFDRLGVAYGPHLRMSERSWSNDREALVEIVLDEEDMAASFVLHPAVMDAAVGACLAVGLEAGASGPSLRIPFHLQSLHIRDRLPARCYAYASSRADAADRYDVVIFNEDGRCLAEMYGLFLRAVRVERQPSDPC